MCAVQAVHFDYSAVPKDEDLRTGYEPSIWLSLWLCLCATIAAYGAQKDGNLTGEDFHEHTATKKWLVWKFQVQHTLKSADQWQFVIDMANADANDYKSKKQKAFYSILQCIG